MTQIKLQLHPDFLNSCRDTKTIYRTIIKVRKNNREISLEIDDILLSKTDPLVLEGLFKQIKYALNG